MRNIARINNYCNRLEAWRDWGRIAGQARHAGRDDLVEKYQPAEDAGWRKIDKAIAKLREELQENESNKPV